jgi:plasmid stabilization system protein ParE
MSLDKTADFIADVECQYEWYSVHAGWEVAEDYIRTVEVACRLLERHPRLGPRAGFSHRRLRDWRFFLVMRPFQAHVLFYELSGDKVVLRRAMHGRRDLRRQLLEPPRIE